MLDLGADRRRIIATAANTIQATSQPLRDIALSLLCERSCAVAELYKGA